ncbi:MAG: tyrosine-type recombinase/integrase [Candidatus Bathyarchaeota archaeon]|nr:tyrosine-type recombinase/integrase [Candidatus Bathyarchaeota archaeon]
MHLNLNQLPDFKAFLEVEHHLAKKTVYAHQSYIKRLIEHNASHEVGREEVRDFMREYLDASISGYCNALKAVRIFFRDYLGRGDLVEGFKFPSTPFKPRTIPERKALTEFYEEIPSIEGRLYFMLYASSGLRRREALGLHPKDVDMGMRMVTPNKGVSGTKNTWVSFYGSELEELLREYKPRIGERWIPIKTDNFMEAWSVPLMKTGLKITPQVLRDWFCVAMGEAGVPDRYVDAFCGRLPRSILARHYTDYSPQRLKKIYEQANIKVFS